MHLLEYNKDGELIITSFDDNKPPPYAILSHRWGEEAEEVSFEDIARNTGKDKYGYRKIRLCGDQAKRDGLQYFWIDTCCINKANKAEHSLAIRSMFRWYRNAAQCYVYLSDVSAPPLGEQGEAGSPPWDSAFRGSEWFARGWTLQELLAPSVVEFFSREWRKLGDRISLKSQIHEVTTIPHEVLEGAPLNQSSVDERFRWIQGRHTKLKEDAAYSLSGIFDVDMAPVYGEGTEEAFRRLHDKIREQKECRRKREECLRDLCVTDPRNDKKRIEETKGGLLADSYRWVLDNAAFQQWQEDLHGRLLWVKGDPGKGKTMLLCGIINELHNAMPKTALLSYFFCQATDLRINNATAVLRGLLYMLVSQQPSLASHVRKRHDHVGKALFEGPNAWVALTEIFVDVLQDPNLSTTYLIIDALDECATDRTKLLEFVAQQSSTSDRVKWIVSSRNWPDIEAQLERTGHKVKLSLELNAESVAAAVDVFIHRKVDQLAEEMQYKAEMRNAVLQHLKSNAHDTFLWVALVCQSLKATVNRHVLKKLASFPPGLDALYKQMLDQMSKSDDAETCRCVLATAAVLYRPVTISELVALVKQLEGVSDDIREIISLCGSFLTLRETTVFFVHQSAKDFLFAEAYNEVFPDGTEDFHRAIFSKSLAVLSSTLRRDMYSLEEPGYPMENAEIADPDPLAASRYSCIYWIDHLCDSKPASWVDSGSSLQVADVIDDFIKKKYLYWLEGLSLCKSIAKGVVTMAKLRHLVEVWNADELLQHVQDAQRFIMYHKGAIESYPLQVYASALLFSPTKSLIRRLFQHEEPEGITIMPGMSDSWGACLQRLEGHSGPVKSVAFSHDSARLASASHDHAVKIWDANSGACLQTLKGHSHWVISVAFSHNSARLASASGDRTVKIWDASSGECLQTLKDHSKQVTSVVFSHDSARLASASEDTNIKIWDASSGRCLQTLEGHGEQVTSVIFSHDSARLASASEDRTVKIWDASSGRCLQTLEGHGELGTSVAFSHDSARLASASEGYSFRIWDASSGACLQTLEGHSHWVISVAFSHDSTRLASVSHDHTVKIWDASSGACIQTLEGHCASATSVAFSHDSARLASASDDHTVMIWDTSSGACLQTLEDHSNTVRSVVFSHDSARLASASHDNTIKIWDTSSVTCLQTLEGHSHWITSVAFSHDSARLASVSHDHTVKIWDASSGKCLQTLEGHKAWLMSVAFSHDSARLASASGDRSVKIWDASSGKCLKTLEGHSEQVTAVAFSHDSARLVSSSEDNTIKIWDASSGACLQTLNIKGNVSQLSFNPTGSCLYTEVGTIAIQSVEVSSRGEIVEFEQPVYTRTSISSDRLWIGYAGNNILWVPVEYRPSCFSVSQSTIAMGSGSGRVWTCRINL